MGGETWQMSAEMQDAWRDISCSVSLPVQEEKSWSKAIRNQVQDKGQEIFHSGVVNMENSLPKAEACRSSTTWKEKYIGDPDLHRKILGSPRVENR